MRLVRLEEVNSLAEAEPAVEQLDLAERVPRALDVEEVLRPHGEQGRPRGPHRHVVGVIQAGGHLAGDVLLGVLRSDRGEEPIQRGDVAGGRGDGDPVVEGHQVRRHRSAARVSRAAQPGRVDLGAAGQVVEGAESVPDPVGRGLTADQDGADARHRVLGGDPSRDGRLALLVEHLHPLALADRVVAEGGHSVPGEQDADLLVRVAGLAVGRVPARNEHPRERRLAVGQVERRRDVMPGPALEDDPLHAVARILPAADDPRIERRPLRQVPQRLEEELLQFLLPLAICSGVLIAATSARRLRAGWRPRREECLEHGSRGVAAAVASSLWPRSRRELQETRRADEQQDRAEPDHRRSVPSRQVRHSCEDLNRRQFPGYPPDGTNDRSCSRPPGSPRRSRLAGAAAWPCSRACRPGNGRRLGRSRGISSSRPRSSSSGMFTAPGICARGEFLGVRTSMRAALAAGRRPVLDVDLRGTRPGPGSRPRTRPC